MNKNPESPYWPGTRIVKSRNNGFNWNTGEPSIFRGRAFEANQHGESASQVASRSVERYELRHGRSQGVIHGISQRADALIGAETFTSRSRGKARAA